MKKLVLSLKWLNILLSFGVIYFALKQLNGFYHFVVNNQSKREIFLGIKIPDDVNHSFYIIASILSFTLLIYLFYLLNIFRKTTRDLSNNLIFNEENGIQLFKIGKGLLVFGIILLIFKITISIVFYYKPFEDVSKTLTYEFGYALGFTMSNLFLFIVSVGFPIFIVSLFLMIISQLIKQGHYLKQENDLTI
ncbi:Protein of unknown function [Hyunsoonleella jejuensis]|uniref:DUF2975 domain-containing protein n=1 Tax=Hyunsoonleella jejuensis TaxID=419940 RepID=A0A1H9ANE1_9FLAO|nr:DUF2975 domain-containing protein [Hyunsoonleella jejuensis]SEP78061.1 Protein of unknown function [Hyunsoonleella jejuensis]